MGIAGAVAAAQDELVRKGLRFPQLRLMVALEETGQISSAAAQLAMTQPAASRLLAELERMTEASLYTRHARGITLTEAGMLLAERARTVLRQLDDARDAIVEITRGARGLVRIGAVTGPALEIILPTIRELRVTYPEIEIAVEVSTSDKLADALMSHAVDFYIGRLPEGMDARAVEMQRIGPEPIGLIVRLDHPLTRKGDLTLEQCLAYDWVMQPTGGLQRRTVETYLLENGYPIPKRVLGTSSLLLTLAIISETNAIAPVARAVGEFYAARSAFGGNIRLLDLDNRIEVAAYSLVIRRGEMLSAPVERVLNHVRARVLRAGLAV
jgi:DNA-binding transcriptional LysR family regulator